MQHQEGREGPSGHSPLGAFHAAYSAWSLLHMREHRGTQALVPEQVKKRKRPKKFRKKQENAKLLLTNLAQVLDACDRAKLEIKLHHGIVFSKYGYVLPFKTGWSPRMQDLSPFWDPDDVLALPAAED